MPEFWFLRRQWLRANIPGCRWPRKSSEGVTRGIAGGGRADNFRNELFDNGSRPPVMVRASRGKVESSSWEIGGCIGREDMVDSGAGRLETLCGSTSNTIECFSGVEIIAVVRPKCLSKYF